MIGLSNSSKLSNTSSKTSSYPGRLEFFFFLTVIFFTPHSPHPILELLKAFCSRWA